MKTFNYNDLLSNEIAGILNSYGSYNIGKQDEQYYIEYEFYSDLGEDVVETIWFDGTNEDFIIEFSKNAYAFDPSEHAEMYIPIRGSDGVPNVSVRDLLEDADGIKETLINIAKELQALN